MALKILYIHGYGAKGNRSGKAIEEQLEKAFGAVRMSYNHYYDEIVGVRQIEEITNRIADDCLAFSPHIVIGSSFGGFLAANILGFAKILINPCLLPSERVDIISPSISDNDLEELKTMERAQLDATAKDPNTWGLFSNHDELFGGSGYKDLYENVYGLEQLYTMDSPHRIGDDAIRKHLVPLIKSIVTDNMPAIIKGQIANCNPLANYFGRYPGQLDAFVHHAGRGQEMDKLRIMTLLTDLYMEYCHVSLGYRTVAYNMGWAVFDEYVKENKTDFTGKESFCKVMGKINPRYVEEDDNCDICILDTKETVECAMNMYAEECDDEMRDVLCYGLLLVALKK